VEKAIVFLFVIVIPFFGSGSESESCFCNIYIPFQCGIGTLVELGSGGSFWCALAQCEKTEVVGRKDNVV
jgi:hypothetical protein